MLVYLEIYIIGQLEKFHFSGVYKCISALFFFLFGLEWFSLVNFDVRNSLQKLTLHRW